MEGVNVLEYQNQNELDHYGVLGMKWYQHKFGEVDGRAKYRDKGFSKLAKKKDKADKNQQRADYNRSKAQAKRDKAEHLNNKLFFRFGAIDDFRISRNDAKARKYSKYAFKYQRKANRVLRSGEKIAKKMLKFYGSMNMSDLTPEQIRTGQQYAMVMLDDRQANHSALDSDFFLEHYGVKGMKWDESKKSDTYTAQTTKTTFTRTIQRDKNGNVVGGTLRAVAKPKPPTLTKKPEISPTARVDRDYRDYASAGQKVGKQSAVEKLLDKMANNAIGNSSKKNPNVNKTGKKYQAQSMSRQEEKDIENFLRNNAKTKKSVKVEKKDSSVSVSLVPSKSNRNAQKLLKKAIVKQDKKNKR